MEQPIQRKMLELRIACERETRIRRERSETALASFRRSLASIRTQAEQNLANREKLSTLKDHLGKMQADLDVALAVKTRKEAKCAAIAEPLSTTVARTEQLERIVKDQRARKDELSAVISEQLLSIDDIEEKSIQDVIEIENTEEAIMWYKKVLGFQTEGGEGVKFIFHNIDMKNPEEAYSFTVRLDGDIYKLLDCDPYMEGVSELIKDMNQTNDLFKFVRIMRQKFQAAALNGALPTASSVNPDASSVTLSSSPPVSVDSRHGIPKKENIPHFQSQKVEIKSRQKEKSGQVAVPSPQSLPTLRRSPRVMAKKKT